ncbi:conjugal transfer protein TraB, partial [Salmonella enterica]|nr:conjugal transfer protein TraB [Salmonella enterica]
MANINHLVRRKQNLYLLLVALGLSGVGGIAWYMSTSKSVSQKNVKAAPVPPNMTGVVSQTFDKKVSDAAVADIHHTASAAEKKISNFEKRLQGMESREKDYRAKIEEQENELAILRA